MVPRRYLAFVLGVALVATACATAQAPQEAQQPSDDGATVTTAPTVVVTTAPTAKGTVPTTTEAAPATTTTEVAPTTTTTMVEVVEVSVMFSELSAERQSNTGAVCTYATDPGASFRETFVGVESFDQVIDAVIIGNSGVPELAETWLELANAGADTNEFLDAAVPICVAIGWSPDV